MCSGEEDSCLEHFDKFEDRLNDYVRFMQNLQMLKNDMLKHLFNSFPKDIRERITVSEDKLDGEDVIVIYTSWGYDDLYYALEEMGFNSPEDHLMNATGKDLEKGYAFVFPMRLSILKNPVFKSPIDISFMGNE